MSHSFELQGNGTVAFVQQTNGELRKSAVDAAADKPLEEIEALLRSVRCIDALIRSPFFHRSLRFARAPSALFVDFELLTAP